MNRLLLLALLILVLRTTARSEHILAHPFDHDETVDCDWGCYTSPFFHSGLDYSCPPDGYPIYAAISGTVHIVDNVTGQTCSPSFGNYVQITQGNYRVINAHLKYGSIVVTEGANVVQGQKIGVSGNTGYTLTSQGACQQGAQHHLHFEVKVLSNGTWTSVNPGTHDGGMWTDPLKYGTATSSLFDLAYSRNGGLSTVGNATTDIYSYGPYLRRDFSGGSYGDCCIMYDPNNGLGNTQATNEAYLLRTGFYEYYLASEEEDGEEWKQYGCPSRDEYITGDGTNAIQFFVQREWNETDEEWKTNFHCMYYDPTPPPNDDIIEWYSTYATEWVSQTPSGKFAMMPGQTKQVSVQFRNESEFYWYNNSGSHPYDFITLKSVGSNGAITESFFNYPVDGSLGWIDTYTPCTMQQSSVAPGQTATFTFTIKVPSNATPGIRQIYFRPYHSTGGLLDDWGGMHFYHYTVVEGVDYDFDGDGIADYWDRTSTGEFHLDYASNNLTEWDTTFYGYGGSNDDPAPADYDGDGKYDMAILKNSNSIFYIDYARNGFGAWDDSLGGYGVVADYPCPGDYDGDKVDDISVRDADGDWHIDYFAIGNGFGAWDTTFYGYGGQYDRPAQADYNGDGKCDFAILRNSDRKFLIDYAPGFGSWDVTNLGGYGGFADYPAPADYDNDGSDDIAVLNTTDRALRVDRTGNGFNGWDYVLGGYGGTGDRPMPADYDGDGWDDVATYYAAYDQICLDYASDNYGSWDWCDDGPDHPTWKVATQEEPATLPTVFSVSQNYPNPFNPATSISYSLPKATHVTLEVYNVLGQRVELLVDIDLPAGNHSAVWEANKQASGVYFYRLRTEDADVTKKMLLLK